MHGVQHTRAPGHAARGAGVRRSQGAAQKVAWWRGARPSLNLQSLSLSLALTLSLSLSQNVQLLVRQLAKGQASAPLVLATGTPALAGLLDGVDGINSVAGRIEESLTARRGAWTSSAYKQHLRGLVSNLGQAHLCRSLLSGAISPEALVSMSVDELTSQAQRDSTARIRKSSVDEASLASGSLMIVAQDCKQYALVRQNSGSGSGSAPDTTPRRPGSGPATSGGGSSADTSPEHASPGHPGRGQLQATRASPTTSPVQRPKRAPANLENLLAPGDGGVLMTQTAGFQTYLTKADEENDTSGKMMAVLAMAATSSAPALQR